MNINKNFNTDVNRDNKTGKDNSKKTVLKGVRVSEEAHKLLRFKSVEENKSIRQLIDELLHIKN